MLAFVAFACASEETMKKERCEKENKFGMCPYVTSQKLLQGKWAILILYALSGGPRRLLCLQTSLRIMTSARARSAFPGKVSCPRN